MVLDVSVVDNGEFAAVAGVRGDILLGGFVGCLPSDMTNADCGVVDGGLFNGVDKVLNGTGGFENFGLAAVDNRYSG